ncbi:ankyrin repeat-containing domain protein [Nemania sp. NC0429]|nr:ankyrin repeat-containing domain protein [Nemania sp. NC0429]
MASPDWERHKATILHLYLLENAPLHHVVSYMEEKYHFVKKKNQYEYQFKKWGVKKNVKKTDWQRLRRQLQERAGKQSEITLFGIPLSTSKIRKETQRYTTIPSASEFGKTPSSPQLIDGIMVRAQTPPITEAITWPSLPWFRFKNSILPALRNPTGLLTTFFAALGSEESLSGYDGDSVFKVLFEVSRNPFGLRTAALHLTNSIPDDFASGRQKTEALSRKELSLSLATEMLKLIFFTLSNNNIPYGNEIYLSVHDKLVLHLVEAVSSSNPDILSILFSGRCATTNAIKESVYGSAIREKHYAIISRLLDSGVSPNTKVEGGRYRQCTLRRGKIRLHWISWGSKWGGLHEAAFTCDIRLAKFLLNAGAHIQHASILEIVAFAGGDTDASDDSLKFAQLLVEHGALVGSPASCRQCRHLDLITPITISVARHNTPLAEYLIEKDTSISSDQYAQVLGCECSDSRWSTNQFRELGISCTPLNVALVLGNREMIRRRLQPVLLHAPQASIDIENTLQVACLTGDADAVSTLLEHYPDILKTDIWARGVNPLVATAWNKDITIADLLLGLDAPVCQRDRDGISQTPAPIHVAAYNGNTPLVRNLISRGADWNVCYMPTLSTDDRPDRLAWLLPAAIATPIQLALWSGSGDTTALLMLCRSNIPKEKLIQEFGMSDSVLISEFAFDDADVLSAKKNVRMALEATMKIGDSISIIRSYFALGGIYRSQDLYLAVQTAIESKDCTVIRCLANHRPIGEIDSYEASALVISIEKQEWKIVSLLLHDPFLPFSSRSYFELSHTTQPSLPHHSVSKRNRAYPDYGGSGLTPLGWAAYRRTESTVKDMMRRGYKFQAGDMELLWENATSDASVTNFGLCSLEIIDLSCLRALLLYSILRYDMRQTHRFINLVNTLDFALDGRHDILARTPLHLAADIGNVEAVCLLLDAGASIEMQEQYTGGRTALQVAADRGRLSVVKCLVDRGAKVEPPTRLQTGATALQYAARKGDLSMAKFLLSRMANIDAMPAKSWGGTALEGAAYYGRLDMVQFLLEMGASLEGEMRIYYVRSVHFATEANHSAVAALLKEYGPWAERHQFLRDRPHIYLQRDAYYVYDAEIDDWQIGPVTSCPDDDQYSVDLFSDFCDPLDYVIEQDDNIEDDSNSLSSNGSSTMDPASETWCDVIDSMIAEPGGHSFIDHQLLGYGMAPSQMSTSRRVIELNERLINGDMVQTASDHNPPNKAAADCLATYERKTLQEGSARVDGKSGFELSTYTPGMSWTGEQSLPLDTVETEWEGPFSNFDEIDDMNRAFGVLPFRLWG